MKQSHQIERAEYAGQAFLFAFGEELKLFTSSSSSSFSLEACKSTNCSNFDKFPICYFVTRIFNKQYYINIYNNLSRTSEHINI